MAFYYDAAQGAYLHATQLYPGYGYWIYISAPDIVQLYGEPVKLDTLWLEKTWNLVELPCGQSSISATGQSPAQSVIFYGYR